MAPTEVTKDRYRPIESVALFVQLLFGVFILGSIVALVTGALYRTALLDLASPNTVRLDDVILTEQRYLAAAGMLSFVNIVLTVAFVVWFWRAYSNLNPLGRVRSRKAGWAIGSWFVPIGNMFIPYRIGAEIWTQSRPEPGPMPNRDPDMEPVISWWALLLIMAVVNQIAVFRGMGITEDPFEIAAETAAVVGLELISSVVSIAAAIAALRFVRLATARQEKLAQLRSEDPVR
ncbi:MAG: DUF4328 domain-containing protein [Actinomycetota bacterium]|nr:DUF4328 domain-containing protein [Actinomycetota bacterium]